MGCYACLSYDDENGESQVATMFDFKFFGYIEDQECEKTESYKYLHQLCDIPSYILNIGYIEVCELRKEEAMKFMALYSKDYCIFQECEQYGEFFGWYREIDNLPEDIILRLCID